MTQTLSLFTDLDQGEYQELMSNLYGVKECYELTKEAHSNLQNMYRKAQEVKALKEKVIPSSVVKKEVIEIINSKLVPYLGILADTQPQAYGATYTKIVHYIELVNTKTRTRRSRTIPEDEANSEVE